MRWQEHLKRAVAEYNRYREPEARAQVVHLGPDTFQVRFTGTFCRSCGAYDWYEDLVWLLKDFGVETEIVAVEEHLDGARVTFRLRNIPGIP